MFSVRDQLVVVDRDLARFYGIRTAALNRAVKRNASRFPEDFAFRITREEWAAVRAERDEPEIQRGGRGYVPCVFTEQGIGMLASVLRGDDVARLTIELLRWFARDRARKGELLQLADRKAQGLLDSVVDAVVMNQDERTFTTPVPVTYFVQAADSGLIKIGSTKNLATRFRSLQLMSPVNLTLLGVVPSDIEDECHRELARWRVHGEWFQPSRRVLAFIRARCTVKSGNLKC